jgi:hypothetical protein
MTKIVLPLPLVLLAMSSCIIITDHAPTSGSLPWDAVQEARIGVLRGVKAVRVLVFGAKILQLGYTDESVQDEIIDRIQKAGIEVEQVTRDRTVATVVTTVTRGYGMPYKVEMTVTEKALLLRDANRDVQATTWEQFEQAGTASEVRDIMLKLADELIADFKLANP